MTERDEDDIERDEDERDEETEEEETSEADESSGSDGSDDADEADEEDEEESDEEDEESDEEDEDESSDESDEEDDESDDESDEDEDDDEESDEDEDDEDDEDEDRSADEPSGPIRYRYYGMSDVGLVREHNEDNFAVANLESGEAHWGGEGDHAKQQESVVDGEVGAKGVLWAVCDGMGGAAAGEVASRMAVDTIREVMLDGKIPTDRDMFARRLVFSIEEAGARIFSAAKMDRGKRGMGTTATVAGLVDHILFVGQVGDSRCYVLRDGKLGLITKDQSLVNQLIEAGQLTEEEAEAFEHSNIILQALGTTEEVSVDLTFMEVRQGDRLMLCSDGLSGLVHVDMIREVMGDGDDIAGIAQRLVEMANGGGGHDNITCVVVDIEGEGLKPSGGAPDPMYMQYPLPPATEDEGLPVREPTMKASTRKPGADVKREPYQSMPPPADVPTKSAWGLLIALVLLVGLVLAVVFATRDEPEQGRVDPPPPIEDTTEPEAVEVCVRSDVIDGDLYVDEQEFGPITENGRICIELLPGSYRFEARSGDSAVVGSTITVREGVPADVELMIPAGSMETALDPDGEPLEGDGLEGDDPELVEGGDPDEDGTDLGTADPDVEEPRMVSEMTTMTTESMTETMATPTMTGAMTTQMTAGSDGATMSTATMTTMTTMTATTASMSAMEATMEETMQESMAGEPNTMRTPPGNPFDEP